MKRRFTTIAALAALTAAGVLAALAIAPTASAYTWDQLPALGYSLNVLNLSDGCHQVAAGYGTQAKTNLGSDCDADFQARLDAFVQSTCPCAQPTTTAPPAPTTTAETTATVPPATTTVSSPSPSPTTTVVTTVVQAPLPTAPTADFTAAVVNSNVVAFTDATTGAVASRVWLFGDGAAATGAAPTHAYAGPGVYSVALIVTDAAGLTSTVLHEVSIAGTSLALGPRQTQIAAAPAVPKTNAGFTDAQARAFLAGKLRLPKLTGTGMTKPLPARQRPYALRVYASGPYSKPALNMFYAVGAVVAHFATPSQRDKFTTAIAAVGRDGLEDQLAQGVTQPKTVTRYGVTIRQYAAATARGIVAGMLK